MGIEIFLGDPPAGIKQWIIDHTTPPTPVPPNGKVLYKTTTGGKWLEDAADVSDGVFNGFENRESAVEVIIPSKDADGNGVTSIGNKAFSGCSGLTSMTFNRFTKNEVKSLTNGEETFIFGDVFYDDNRNPIEKSFTAICTDGSMTIHFSANNPATITFTDL